MAATPLRFHESLIDRLEPVVEDIGIANPMECSTPAVTCGARQGRHYDTC